MEGVWGTWLTYMFCVMGPLRLPAGKQGWLEADLAAR